MTYPNMLAFKNMSTSSQDYLLQMIQIVNHHMILSYTNDLEPIPLPDENSILMKNLLSEGKEEIIHTIKKANDTIREIWGTQYVNYLDISNNLHMNSILPKNPASEIEEIDNHFFIYFKSIVQNLLSHLKTFSQYLEKQELSLNQYTEELYQKIIRFKYHLDRILDDVRGQLISNLTNKTI